MIGLQQVRGHRQRPDAGAALRFELRQVGDDDLEAALTAACTCCILAAAGPQRSRVLANLYKDERAPRLPVFPFLQKVYLERILRRDEVRGAAHAATRPCQPSGPRRSMPVHARQCSPSFLELTLASLLQCTLFSSAVLAQHGCLSQTPL